jgi:excisionase family DNA binding protein
LSLGPAARLIGVDPDTLRRWADQGRVEAYTTPGGHRRFDRRALERLIAGRRIAPSTSLSALGATPERLNRAYRRSYARSAAGPDPSGVDDPAREAFRRDGRRLVGALLAYLDAPDAESRQGAEDEAGRITDELAARTARAGTSLTEAVALFVAARRPFLTELGSIARRRSLDSNRLSALYEDASALLDRLLLRLIGGHRSSTASADGADPTEPTQ